MAKSTCDDLLKGNRAHEVIGCPQVVLDRVFANLKANQDKMNKLSSIKSSNAKTKESKGKQPAEANTNKTGDVEKPKRDISSATQMKSSSIDMASKRKRDAEEDVQESEDEDSDDEEAYQQSSYPSKKPKTSVNPATEESKGDTGSDKTDYAEYPEDPSDIEELLYAPPVSRASKKPAAGPSRPVQAPKGAVPVAAKKPSSVVNSAIKQKRGKRAAADIDSDDEVPEASRKKQKAQGGNLTPAQTVAQSSINLTSSGNAAEDTDHENDADFSSAPTRGRTARKAPRGTQTGSKPAPSRGCA